MFNSSINELPITTISSIFFEVSHGTKYSISVGSLMNFSLSNAC